MNNDLDKNGFIGPFDLAAPDIVNRLVKQLDVANGQFKNFHLKSESCRRLLSDSALASKIESAFGSDLRLWRTNSFKKVGHTGEVAWHHDRHFESGDAPIDFNNLSNHFSILVALSDMNAQTGLMEFIPGSHQLSDDFYRDSRPFHKKELSEHFISVSEELASTRVQVPLKKGQFMLFHSALLHRSLAAEEGAFTRYSLVGRLCRKGTNIPTDLAKQEEIMNYPHKFDSRMRFVDSVVFISGGTRGIGLALAKGFLKEGAKVIITGRSKEKLSSALQELTMSEADNNNLLSYVADAGNYQQMKQVFDDIQRKVGAPDILFANAAVNNATGKMENIDPEAWLQEVNTNISATFVLCKLAATVMKKRGGNIITLGSAIGHNGAAGCSAYAVAKAANWSLTQSLAKELSGQGINVNELIPGPVKTDMNPNASGKQWKEPDDVVEMAMLLASQNTEFGASGQSWAMKR